MIIILELVGREREREREGRERQGGREKGGRKRERRIALIIYKV